MHRFDWQKTQTAGVPAPGSKNVNPSKKSSIRVLLCWAPSRNDAISRMILRPILYRYIPTCIVQFSWWLCQHFFDWNVQEILPLSAFVFVDRLGLYWTRRRWRVKCKLMSFISLTIYLRRNVYLTLWRNNFQFEKKWGHYDIALLLSTYLQI